jgi:septal ring factor EnvC (AmiA/AmiB activator)
MDNGHEPATKADLEQLRSEIKENAEQLRSEFHHGFDELKESLRDVQTELLKAFYSFAQSSEAKLKDAETSDTALRQRLTAVEMRLTEVEKRLNLPPAA